MYKLENKKIRTNKKMRQRIKDLQKQKQNVYNGMSLEGIKVIQDCNTEYENITTLGVDQLALKYCTNRDYILGKNDYDSPIDSRKVFEIEKEDIYKISNILYCYQYDTKPYFLYYIINILLLSLDEVLGIEFLDTLDEISGEDWQVFNNLYLNQILNNDSSEYTSFTKKIIKTSGEMYNITFSEDGEDDVEIKFISDILAILTLVRPTVKIVHNKKK